MNGWLGTEILLTKQHSGNWLCGTLATYRIKAKGRLGTKAIPGNYTCLQALIHTDLG